MIRPVLTILVLLAFSGCALQHDWRHDKDDRDNDGIADRYDHCPNTPRGLRVDYVGCHADADGDGIPDGLDRCPNTPAGSSVDYLGCALDGDCDGVPDHRDECPRSPAGAQVDMRGCSPVSPDGSAPQQAAVPVELMHVYFASDSAELDQASLNILELALRQLQANPQWQLQLDGHTDSRATDDYNLALSWRRVRSVADWMAQQGIPLQRLRLVPHGATTPSSDNATSQGRARNRRVELKLLRPALPSR